MNKNKDKSEENVIQFPNVEKMLAEKGTEALENKKYEEALKYFEQLLIHEPNNEPAHIGKAIAFIELGRHLEARDLCESMLKEGIGDYFEVLQIYTAVLIQEERYEQVAQMLEVVIQEEKLPAPLAERFYELLAFSRSMAKEQEKKETLSEEEVEHYRILLHSEQMEDQMNAIKHLTHNPKGSMLEIMKQYLRDEKNHPLLKSFIIKNLAEQKIDEPFEIQKFQQRVLINPAYVQDVFAQPLAQKVEEKLAEMIENENPTLFALSIEVWSQILMMIYPLPLPQMEHEVIAAAIHYESSRLNGIDPSLETICRRYQIEQEDLRSCLRQVEYILQYENGT